MRLISFLLLAILAFCTSVTKTAEAQTSEQSQVRRSWGSLSLGLGSIDREDATLTEISAFAGHVGYHWQRGHRLISLRTAASFEVELIGNFLQESTYDPPHWIDAGGLIGVATTWRYLHATLGVGGAVVYGEGTGIEEFITVGVPLEAQLFYGVDLLGIGFYIFANVNAVQSFAGVALSLQYGDLK
ncbi:MAG: hypothetical protein ACR2GR_05920 [Rhodothermales bacterium]